MNVDLLCDKHLENSFYIKFYPQIKSSLGCEKATLILGRFEYWFTKYKEGFYKFIEPCKHPLYRMGDSWSEEIGFSRKVFTKAFDLIGVRYKSKSAFQKSKNKFQGKLYASYHDRKTNQTYFFRNHDFAKNFIKSLFKRNNLLEKPSSKKKKPQKLFRTSSSKNDRSRNAQVGRSFNIIQINTSSLDCKNLDKKTEVLDYEQQKVMKDMIEIWKEEIGEVGINFSDLLLKRLNEAFINFFNKSIESWKEYCQIIASSKFLMGEAKNKFFKKAWIIWAITEKAIRKIRGGAFKIGDRQTVREKKIHSVELELRELSNKKNKIKLKIEEIHSFTKHKRLQKIREKIQSLSAKNLIKAKKEYEEYLKKENNSISEQYRKHGWKGLFVESYFEDFLKEKMEICCFSSSLEEEVNQNVINSGLRRTLQETCDKMKNLKENILSFSKTVAADTA
jgi:hypothetical protein